MKLRHILVEHKYMAEDILKKLSEGELFETLARFYSECSSANEGGNLGDMNLKRLDSDFAEAVQHLQPGQRSLIFKTRFGYHIAESIENKN